MHRGKANSSSESEEEGENGKLILTNRVAERISDPRVERLARKATRTLYEFSTESTEMLEVSRTMHNTRGIKRKLMNILGDENSRAEFSESRLEINNTLTNGSSKRGSRGGSVWGGRGQGRGRGRGRGSKALGCSPMKTDAKSERKKLTAEHYQKACEEIASICNPEDSDADAEADTNDDATTIAKCFSNAAETTTEILTAEDYLTKPPIGVLGAGKGEAKKLPAFEYGSLFQYQIPSNDAPNPAPWIADPAKVPDDIELNIKSVVGLGSLGCEIDLMRAAQLGINLTYDPESGNPMIMRLKKPYSSAMIFKSGRIVISGTKSEEASAAAANKFTRIFKNLGFPAKLLGYRIVNMSATCNLNFRVRVHLLAKDSLFKNVITYYPEMFAAVCIRLAHPKCTIMVFCTGSVLIAGVRSEADLRDALQKVYPVIKLYAN